MENQYSNAAKIVGAILVVGIIWGGYRFVASRKGKASPTPSGFVTSLKNEEQGVEGKTGLTVPDNGEKAVLKDVTGKDAVGIARRDKEGRQTFYEVTASLPEPEIGKFYQGWVFKGGDSLSLGQLRAAKGGYLVERTFTDISGFDRVVVSLEGKADNILEKRVLEGDF